MFNKSPQILEYDLRETAEETLDGILAVDDTSFFTEPVDAEPSVVVAAERKPAVEPAPGSTSAARQPDSVAKHAPARDRKSAVHALAAAGALLAVTATCATVLLSRNSSPQSPVASPPTQTSVATATETKPIVAPKRPRAEKPVRKKRSTKARPTKKRKPAKSSPRTSAPAAAVGPPRPVASAPAPAPAAAPDGYSGEFSIERSGQ